MDYYEGYMLDDLYVWELGTEDVRLLDACIWLVENHEDIRCVARNFGYSKSELHRQIHCELRQLSYELYVVVVRVLGENVINNQNVFRMAYACCRVVS